MRGWACTGRTFLACALGNGAHRSLHLRGIILVNQNTVEFIPNAGACLTSRNVMSGAGWVKFMVREISQAPADNGWRVFSHIDTSEYLSDNANMQIVAFNDLSALEPALIGIYDFPVGSDLQIVDDGRRLQIVDTRTGQPVPEDQFYIPGNPTRDWGQNTPRPNPADQQP